MRYKLAMGRSGWDLMGLIREDRGGYSFFYRGGKCVRVILTELLSPVLEK